ncbi:MAG: permease [Bacteroidales bacterium]
MQYFNELLSILNAMSPYLLLGFLIAGLLHVYLPKRAFSRYLSKKGFKSVFLSALFGVPLPLCSCGVIPTAMSLKKEGASDGATVSFLIATPQTGVDSILATYGVLGLPFAIIRPIVAFVVAIFGGLLVDRFSVENDDNAEQNIAQSCTISKSKQLTLIDVFKYGFVDMLQDLGKWLTIGLVIAAAITAFVPSGVFELLGDYYALNILVVLLLSIPMYICSTGSIPIALSLLMMGISPGAALVFLMAGPATNVATLAVLRKVLGVRTTLLYLLTIILGAIGFAVVIDFALPTEWFTAKLMAISNSAHCGTGDVVWWQLASTILFILLLVNAYIQKFRGNSHTHEAQQISIQRFKATGMRCNHCKANVEKAINALPNVTKVDIELSSGIIEVEGDIRGENVCTTVKQLGFEIEPYK